MESNKNTHATPLQDLIQILTERVKFYSAAISLVDADKDVDLIAILEKCMQLSQQFKSELNGVLAKEDSPFSEREWVAGDLYTRWQEQKPSMEGIKGRDQVAEAWAQMENTIEHIFQHILADASHFAENTAAMLKSQAALQQEIAEQIEDARKADGRENRKER